MSDTTMLTTRALVAAASLPPLIMEMLSHHVHRGDRRARGEAGSRSWQSRLRASAPQAAKAAGRTLPANQRDDRDRPHQARSTSHPSAAFEATRLGKLSGHRMRSFKDLNVSGLAAIAVTCHYYTSSGIVPDTLERLAPSVQRLARADHDRSPLRLGRKMGGERSVSGSAALTAVEKRSSGNRAVAWAGFRENSNVEAEGIAFARNELRRPNRVACAIRIEICIGRHGREQRFCKLGAEIAQRHPETGECRLQEPGTRLFVETDDGEISTGDAARARPCVGKASDRHQFVDQNNRSRPRIKADEFVTGLISTLPHLDFAPNDEFGIKGNVVTFQRATISIEKNVAEIDVC